MPPKINSLCQQHGEAIAEPKTIVASVAARPALLAQAQLQVMQLRQKAQAVIMSNQISAKQSQIADLQAQITSQPVV